MKRLDLPTQVFSLEPAAVMRVLARLRYLAAALVALALILMAGFGLAVPLILWLLPAGLLVFNGWMVWRLRRGPEPAALELVGHLGVDTLALFVLFWALGGATNPFVSLFLVPVALAASALSIRHAIAVALLSVAAYTALLARYLLHVRDPEAVVGFERHVIGMWVNFLLAAALLCGFLLVLAAVLRTRERELAAQRERLMRDDTVVSVATVAAGAAHALNTPLSTIAVAAESLAEHPRLPYDAVEEVATIRSQAELCAEQLRQLVVTRDPRAQTRTPLADYAAHLIERWHTRRPEIDIVESGRDRLSSMTVRNDPALGQALSNLIDNAADAAIAAGDHRLWLGWHQDDATLTLTVDDPGEARRGWPGHDQGRTTKADGLGLGLTLARASLSRLGGELAFSRAARHGTRTTVRLPLAALDASEAVT